MSLLSQVLSTFGTQTLHDDGMAAFFNSDNDAPENEIRNRKKGFLVKPPKNLKVHKFYIFTELSLQHSHLQLVKTLFVSISAFKPHRCDSAVFTRTKGTPLHSFHNFSKCKQTFLALIKHNLISDNTYQNCYTS